MWPNAEVSEREDMSVLICHCSDGQNCRLGRGGWRTRELGGFKSRCEHVHVHKKLWCAHGQNHMQHFRIFTLRSIMEVTTGCATTMPLTSTYVWVSKQTISLQEAKVLEVLQYDMEILCVVQWWM